MVQTNHLIYTIITAIHNDRLKLFADLHHVYSTTGYVIITRIRMNRLKKLIVCYHYHHPFA